MACVGDGFGCLCAAGVVEIDHQLRVACEPFGGGHVFDPVLRPQTAFVAERAQPAFGAAVAAWCPPMMQTTGGVSLVVDAEEDAAQTETVQAKAA